MKKPDITLSAVAGLHAGKCLHSGSWSCAIGDVGKWRLLSWGSPKLPDGIFYLEGTRSCVSWYRAS